jgi:hypothetical protein
MNRINIISSPATLQLASDLTLQTSTAKIDQRNRDSVPGATAAISNSKSGDQILHDSKRRRQVDLGSRTPPGLAKRREKPNSTLLQLDIILLQTRTAPQASIVQPEHPGQPPLRICCQSWIPAPATVSIRSTPPTRDPF